MKDRMQELKHVSYCLILWPGSTCSVKRCLLNMATWSIQPSHVFRKHRSTELGALMEQQLWLLEGGGAWWRLKCSVLIPETGANCYQAWLCIGRMKIQPQMNDLSFNQHKSNFLLILQRKKLLWSSCLYSLSNFWAIRGCLWDLIH